jgi:serine/threonine-protein kinase RsbW
MHAPQSLQPENVVLHVANTRQDIERAEAALLDALVRFGYPEAARFAVRLALEEALINAFRHGHRGLPPEATVRFEFAVGPDSITMDIQDRGPGFDPATVQDPTLDQSLELPTGRGMLLMRAYMSSVEYLGCGNRVRMVFHSKPAP